MSVKPPSKEECQKRLGTYLHSKSVADAANKLGMSRTTLEQQLFENIPRWYPDLPRVPRPKERTPPERGRIEIDVEDGVVVVGSDGHYWPGLEPPTAHRAMVHFCNHFRKEKMLRVVIKNGDAMDLPRISRWPPPGFAKMPEVHEEIEEVQDRLSELEEASGKARKIYPWGNHDQRFFNYISTHATEVALVSGMQLKDHFTLWEPCNAVFINNRPGGVIVKHRQKGGMHAAHNNALWAGRSMVTGHDHALGVREITDLNGTRYGVNTGMLADPWGPQFTYLEGGLRNWRAGFAVLTFRGGELMPPELVTVVDDGVVVFRGEQLEV